MYGAIIGDISGSEHEFQHPPLKDYNYEFFGEGSFPTDDTIMTCAIAQAIMDCKFLEYDLSTFVVKRMQEFGRKYPNAGYGGMFMRWIYSKNPKPYNSFGNGSAMRVSPIGWIANTPGEVRTYSRLVTEITHNHPEGIKGAEAVAMCILFARLGASKSDLRTLVNDNYYKLDFTLSEIHDGYRFDETCQGSVPQAIEAFLESDSFEDAVRKAVSLGGDTDTQGAITGSIAEAFYGIPQSLIGEADRRLAHTTADLIPIINKFSKRYVL